MFLHHKLLIVPKLHFYFTFIWRYHRMSRAKQSI